MSTLTRGGDAVGTLDVAGDVDVDSGKFTVASPHGRHGGGGTLDVAGDVDVVGCGDCDRTVLVEPTSSRWPAARAARWWQGPWTWQATWT